MTKRTYKTNKEYLGTVHLVATCAVCDWINEDYKNAGLARRAIRKHVSETGHSVSVETAVAEIYTAV